MTTARSIVEGALGFGLNRLSPGETLDADTGATCLVALNMLADEFNGSGSFLFREILTAGTVTSQGTLGTTWAAIAPGIKPLGVTYNDGSIDHPVYEMTMEQYQSIADKSVTGYPDQWAWDGYATIYFAPLPVSLSVKIRTRQAFSNFADLDTDYDMPQGYKSAFSDMLARKMAPQLVGSVSNDVARNDAAARARMLAKNMKPAIINVARHRPNILTGP